VVDLLLIVVVFVSGWLYVQGQSVIVKVVDSVMLYVWVPMEKVVGVGQTVVRMSVV
jgi:hypothetical protein